MNNNASRHMWLSVVLDTVLVGLALMAWLSLGEGRTQPVAIASLFGAIVLSLMWVHYVSDAVAPSHKTTKFKYYKLSRWVVLITLILHPLLINSWLVNNGFGWPPNSYELLIGSTAWGVALGLVAFIIFLAFELYQRLPPRWQRIILHLNIGAMFLIFAHGFIVGIYLMHGWYLCIWWILLTIFTVVALRRYYKYYQDNLPRRFIAWSVIAILTCFAITAGLGLLPGSHSHDNPIPEDTQSNSQNTESSDGISLQTLSSKTGKNGDDCWVAVDRVVYDATNNSEWRDGIHVRSNGLATCGRDLSNVIRLSPHGKSNLQALPVVGRLEAAERILPTPGS